MLKVSNNSSFSNQKLQIRNLRQSDITHRYYLSPTESFWPASFTTWSVFTTFPAKIVLGWSGGSVLSLFVSGPSEESDSESEPPSNAETVEPLGFLTSCVLSKSLLPGTVAVFSSSRTKRQRRKEGRSYKSINAAQEM